MWKLNFETIRELLCIGGPIILILVVLSAVSFTISIIKPSQFPQAKIFSSNIAVAIADAHEAICQGNKGYAGKDVPVQEAICRWLFKQSWSY